MTDSARVPLLIAAVAIILVCFVALTAFLWPIRGVVLQVYAIVAILTALRVSPPIARWLETVPFAHRAILYALIAAVVAGHFTLSTRRFYPFVAWDIFSSVSRQETVFCHELIGTTASQKKVRLLVEQLYPSIIQFDLPPTNQPAKLDLLVSAMAKTYDARHAADPLREIDLMLMAVRIHPPPGQTHHQPSCELLQRFDLSQGPSS